MGAEFASVFHALGTRVSIVEAMERLIPIPSMDEDSSRLLQREFKKKKLPVFLNKTVVRTERTSEGSIKVFLGPSPFLEVVKEMDQKEIELQVDRVLITVGRKYNSDGIGLKALGMEVNDRGWLPVNDRVETSIPGIYAIGDLLGPEQMMLAHTASAEALVAVENALGGNAVMNYRTIPAVFFTSPEVATVGISEAEAKKDGLAYRADTFHFRGLGKPQAMGKIAGHVKIVSENPTGQSLGVHIIGPHATDLIAEAALAMKHGLSTKDLAKTIHLHPSLSEAVMEAAHATLDNCLHLPPV